MAILIFALQIFLIRWPKIWVIGKWVGNNYSWFSFLFVLFEYRLSRVSFGEGFMTPFLLKQFGFYKQLRSSWLAYLFFYIILFRLLSFPFFCQISERRFVVISTSRFITTHFSISPIRSSSSIVISHKIFNNYSSSSYCKSIKYFGSRMFKSQKYLGAIDQGTTSTRFLLFDLTGNIVASHNVAITTDTPNLGY